MDAPRPSPLRVVRAAQIPDPSTERHPWLVEPLWSAGAVGLIGGLAAVRGAEFAALDVHLIIENSLRLDRQAVSARAVP